MVRLIFLGVLLLLILVGGLAVALFHFYGWKGALAFPILVLALVWLGKMFMGKMLKSFALSLFSMKSRVLRGATMTVHCIVPVPKPAETEIDEEEEDSEEDSAAPAASKSEAESAAEAEDEQVEKEAEEFQEPEEPKEYFAVDLTIKPQDSNQGRVWEPGEFILTSEKIKSLDELEDGERGVGSVQDLRIWDGSQFGPDDAGKYPGAQRLMITFAVKPGTTKAWLHYYSETIDLLELPAWKPTAVC